MKEFLQLWWRSVYEPPLKVFGFLHRCYVSNRTRIKAWLAQPRMAVLSQAIMVLTAVIWLLVWLLAPEASRDVFTDAVKEKFNQLQQ